MSKSVKLFVKMDVDLGDHFKVQRLTTRLSDDVVATSKRRFPTCHDGCDHMEISVETVIGYLYRLWSWAMRYDPENGSFERLDEIEIARIAHYPGDPNVFAKALLEVDFVTADQEIHGWDEVYGAMIDKKEKDREYQQRRRDENKPTSKKRRNDVVPTSETRLELVVDKEKNNTDQRPEV